MPYLYREAQVVIPRGAEVTALFRDRDGVFGDAVQRALDSVEPWERGEDPIEGFDLPFEIGARAVLLAGTENPFWGIHPRHTARAPGLSPFIRLKPTDERGSTTLATLELAGTVEEPLLTRVYPGEYMPPLPWMKSAANADGGLQACFEYWRDHAFVLREQSCPTELTNVAPDWHLAEAL